MTIGVNTGSTIQASQIRTEFGASAPDNGVSLGNYRLTRTVGELSLPLDEGVPTSGPIKMSDFSQKSLNVVVNVHSGGVEYGVNAKAKYNNNEVTVICPISRSKKQSGSKIIIHCNKKLGAVSNPGHNTPQTRCALKTGTWSNPVHVHVILGGEANVRGSGGKGGDGKADNSGSAQAGAPGSSGLGIEHEGTLITLKSGSQIVRGSGGGGGGGHATETSKHSRNCGGSGGGGGAGFPPGTGGEKGIVTSGRDPTSGVDGENGTESTGGEGGGERNNASEAFGGNGGNGGSVNGGSGDGSSGESGNGRGEYESEGGSGGEGGAAIRKSVAHYHIISNSGTITGSTSRTGVS